MSDSAMQPEPEGKAPLGAPSPSSLSVSLTWSGDSVSIMIPSVNGVDPTEVMWDGTSLTQNGSNRWQSSTSRPTNTLSATYGSTTYANGSIAQNETSAVLTK